MTASKTGLIQTDLSWDHRDSPSFEDLQRALKPLGVHVTEDPRTDGTDSFGFIFSNRELTRAELRDLDDYGDDDDSDIVDRDEDLEDIDEEL